MKQTRLLTILWAMTLMLAIVPQRAWASYRAVATKGKLPGAFSVSATKQVWFSQGNLQYQADNGNGGSTWRFAIKQYDFVGDATHGNVYEKDVKTGGLMVQGASAWNGSGSSGDPYLIASPADWNTLASNVANGNTYSNTYFKLTADITVTTMVTATFSGTFDGGGHTLTFNYTATGDNAAPFAYITGATIENLRVAGTITTSKKFAAGIVAISNGGTITNCRSSVTIASSTSGDGTHGGLVADSFQGKLDINNCLFDGKLLGTTTTSCGGIVGWHKQGTLNITNTLFAPAEVTVQVQGGAIFARNGATSLDNCYYISDWSAATVQGTNANSMTTAALVTALNGSNKNWCIHRGNAIPIMVNLVISTEAQWDTFAANVGNYDGKYVQLGANIGTANAPITTMTTSATSFKGIFDGNGYTLTVNLTNSGGNVAPFYYLYGGTIMNLTVSGGVTTAGSFNAGLVARTHGGINYIQNCIIHTNVAVGNYGGGVVGHADDASSLTISDCIYDGTITHTGSYAGGFIGWYNNDKTLDLVMTNCLFKGTYSGSHQFHPIGVKLLDGKLKSSSITNCYYTTNPHNASGNRVIADGTKVSELTIGTTGVSIASGSYATFQGTKYYYGTVTLGYNGPMATTNFSLDGTHLNDNSFTISTDNAAFDDGTATIKWDFPGKGTEEEPYLIPSTEVWNYLADQVNGGTNYSGKYFQQTGDFTVSSKIIGYPTDDTHYVTFNGIYDGNGHTITASINKSGERYVAPFHCIADASIKNVVVTGSVTVSGGASIERRRHPAGLVGVTDGTCILQNCRVSANVSGCDYMGGLIGHTQNANITITGCVYSGILTASDSNNTGGLIGWGGDNGGKTYALTNNLFAGSYSGSGKFHPVGFLFNPTGNTRTVTNTYYMTGLQNVGDDDGNSLVNGLSYKGKFAYSITAGSDVTVAAAGEPTATYNVSKLDFFGTNGFALNGALYGGQGDAVSLNLGYTPQSGYSFHSFTASAGTLTGSSNPYTLTMTNDNATISARYSAAINIAATTTNAKDGWYLIASPFVSVTPSTENGFLTNNYDLFRFNQSAEMEWQNYQIHHNATENPFNALVSGQGYLYANSSNVTLTFIGTPYSGTGEFALEYSTSNPDTRMRGWNLISNPFGVQATIDKDCYKMNDETHTEVILCNKPATVDPMEGVFVQATAENQSVTFSTGAKRETAGSEDCIVINLSGSKGTIIDRAIVSFDNGRTLPKFQIKENSTKLYIPQKGTDYAIAFSYRIGELPLNFKPQETGVYTLSFSGENMTNVSLVDMIENAVVDLSVKDTYSFIGSPTDRENRFKLVFNSFNSSNIDIFAYQNGNDIVVSGEGELQVFDVMGRMVLTQHINDVQTIAKPLQTGVYILRLNEKSQKIVVR